MNASDTYKTIATPSEEVLFKDRNSKFYGYAFPVRTEDEIKSHLAHLRKQHHQARHWCYAWQLGTAYDRYRTNDDGEPSNSAGAPIYGQIQSFELTEVLVVVVRYFGGTKLGVGGLINAYRTAAQWAIAAAPVIEKTIQVPFTIRFDYPLLSKVMRLIRTEKLNIIQQEQAMDCCFQIGVRKKEADRIIQLFRETYGVHIED